MKKYKILTKDMAAPFQGWPIYKIGKEYICNDFDISNVECSHGFYATDIGGLIYTNLSNNKRVFEVDVSGKERIFHTYRQRFEKMKIIKEIETHELRGLVKAQSDGMNWNYYDALFPFNPFSITPIIDKEKAIILLSEWASVRDSVWASVAASVAASVGTSVRDSVWASVAASVAASVGTSVRDSVWAYQGSLFPGIDKWKYINHEKRVYPFQSGSDLWFSGLIPIQYQGNWHLYSKNGLWLSK